MTPEPTEIRSDSVIPVGARPSGVHLLGLTVGLFWLQLIGHELAHDVALTAMKAVVYPGTDFGRRWPLPAQISYFGGGPLFTLLLVVSSAAVASVTHSGRTRTIAAALCTAAVVRIMIIGPKTLLGLPTDERALGQFLDVAPQLLGIAQLVVAAAAVTAIYQAFPPQDRRPFMTWAASGALLGLVSALAFGPLLGLPVGTILG